jgi:hypothetical protein
VATPKLDMMISRLRAMNEGEAGILLRPSELIELEIPDVPEVDLHARAKWLCEKLPFHCAITPSVTTGDYGFRRMAAKGMKQNGN